MTFRLAEPDAIYARTVQVDVPLAAGAGEKDETEQVECTLHFRLLGRDEAEQLAKITDDDRPFMRAAVRGWENVVGADGKPLPYTAENVDLLAGIPYFARAVLAAYYRLAQGLPGKTFTQPRSTGADQPRAATTP